MDRRKTIAGNTRVLSLIGMVTALVTLATYYLKVPGPTGFYHMGDGIIYSSALALGPLIAVPSAAIGSALADILGGYAMWAPWTLVIKGATAWLVGTLGTKPKETVYSPVKKVPAMVAGAAVTVAGYFLATYVMWDFQAAVVELIGNVLQTGSGVLAAVFLTPIFEKIARNL